MKKPRILVGVPHHASKAYCRPLFMESLNAIGRETTSAAVELVARFDPSSVYGEKDNVKKQREWFRRLALEGGFDALYFHGHDTIPPANVIDVLLPILTMSDDVGIASGVYFNRIAGGETNAVAWCDGTDTEEKDRLLKGDTPVVLSGCGLDCALIPRAVLEEISWMSWGVNDDDYPFCECVRGSGRSIIAVPLVQCRHYETADRFSYRGEIFTRHP